MDFSVYSRLGYDSLPLENERRDRVSGNDARNGGISLHATRRSRVTGNDAPSGIALDANSDRNRIADNEVQWYVIPGLIVAGDRNRLLRNDVSGGATVRVSGRHNRVLANRVRESRSDGIEVTAAANRLGDNVAVDNAELGIDAVSGTIDLGGNRASGNGDPRQCVGVSCSSRSRRARSLERLDVALT